MPAQVALAAALLFTQEELGGPVVENESTPQYTTVPIVLAPGNGDRVGLIIQNLSTTAIAYIGLAPVPSSTNALSIAPGGTITLTVRDDFTLCVRQWNAVGTANPQQFYVLEINRFRAIPVGA